jgi:phosphoglycolate phosphatase-like HAD superfamily hydrolase
MNHTAQAVFVDVDDTLVRSSGAKRIPMPQVIAAVRRLHAQGARLFLWSTGGADYAQATARDLGLESCFVAFLSKPDVYIDDQAAAAWRNCRHVLPGNAGSLSW